MTGLTYFWEAGHLGISWIEVGAFIIELDHEVFELSAFCGECSHKSLLFFVGLMTVVA